MSDDSALSQRPATDALVEDNALVKPPVSTPRIFLNETMLSHLQKTSPWLRFMGVLCYIGSAMLILLGLIMAAVAPFMEDLTEILDGAGGIILGIVYAGLGIVMLFPSRFLYNFGARLRNFFLNYREQELEQALRNNQALWKFYGILSIAGLALMPLAIIVGIILGLSGY